jgi:hypothetical protein
MEHLFSMGKALGSITALKKKTPTIYKMDNAS